MRYNFHSNILNLKVKKSTLFVRFILFTLSFCFFVFPFLGLIFGVVLGSGLQIGNFIAIGIFYLMGFYLLRLSLWNTYGEENIQFFENSITYEASYGWFKDAKKEFLISFPKYSFKSVGYEEDNEVVLLISSEECYLESVVKMPSADVEALIIVLEQRTADHPNSPL